MKKILFATLALLFSAGQAMAQGPVFTIDDVTVADGKGTIEVKFNFDKDDYYGNFQMDLLLPEGVTPVTTGRNSIKGDTDSFVDAGFSLASNVLTVDVASDPNYGKKVLRIIGTNNDGYALIGTAGTLLTIPVTVEATGMLEATMNNAIINVATKYEDGTDNPDYGKEQKLADVVFHIINGHDTVGINAVAADSAGSTLYDLQGRRVTAQVQGINIVNGKKTMVR